jgi:hypothetical protein
MPEENPVEFECPTTCPNRRRDGVTLRFGDGRTMHLDPFEIALYLLLMLPAGVMIREAFQPDYTFEKAIARTSAVAAMLWGIRKAPTQDFYQWALKVKLGN